MKATEKEDKVIGNMFDGSYRSDPEPAIVENFDNSVRFYHDYITKLGIKSVLDVGMGAGGLLLALQNSGIEHVYGIELSHEGVELAKQRFEQYGDLSKAELFEGSFMDYSIDSVDVIYFHRVIHCHPDYNGLIQKAIEIGPRYILYTLPRDNWLAKLFLGSISILSKPTTGFRPYVHPVDKIKHIFVDGGYDEIHHSSTRFWETSVFENKSKRISSS